MERRQTTTIQVALGRNTAVDGETTKVAEVVAATTAVAVVETTLVAVAVQATSRHSPMVRRLQAVAHRLVAPSIRWQQLVDCHRDQRSGVVAEATRTSPTASRKLRLVHRQSPTTSITSQPRDLRQIPRVGLPLAQHKPGHRSPGTCEPSASPLVRPTSSTCER